MLDTTLLRDTHIHTHTHTHETVVQENVCRCRVMHRITFAGVG